MVGDCNLSQPARETQGMQWYHREKEEAHCEGGRQARTCTEFPDRDKARPGDYTKRGIHKVHTYTYMGRSKKRKRIQAIQRNAEHAVITQEGKKPICERGRQARTCTEFSGRDQARPEGYAKKNSLYIHIYKRFQRVTNLTFRFGGTNPQEGT